MVTVYQLCLYEWWTNDAKLAFLSVSLDFFISDAIRYFFKDLIGIKQNTVIDDFLKYNLVLLNY